MYSLIFFVSVTVVTVTARAQFALNEHWVCGVKKSCVDCLQLPHCSWCQTENKCFSQLLANDGNNESIGHVDYGLSFEENAECSCARGKMDLQCYPPGVTEGTECSGRGECVCGHCVCNSAPDIENPTKTVMGEYCEFDNFSCVGPKCNEGPYSRNDEPVAIDGDDDSDNVIDDPVNIEDK